MGIRFEPIGKVESEYRNPRDLVFACERGINTKTQSKIIVNKKFEKGLYKLEEFSHLFIVYVLHQADKIELITHPGPSSEVNLPKVGVFASRSQYRPNHIALRLVKLQKIEKNILFVEGFDAIDGTNVLDIKPYVKGFDRPNEFKTAKWYDWLEK